jgi:hypothetical protein
MRVLCMCTVERIYVDNSISPINSSCQEQEGISGESRTHEPCSSLNVVGKGIQNGKLNGHGCRAESLRQSVIVSLQSVVVVVPPPAASSTLSKPSTFSIPFLCIKFQIEIPGVSAQISETTHADSDKDETFGLGQLERALDGSADAEHGYSRFIALPIETQAQVTPLGLFDELAARWMRCRCHDCGWW